MNIEPLESRTLCSVTVIDRVARVYGTPRADTIEVDLVWSPSGSVGRAVINGKSIGLCPRECFIRLPRAVRVYGGGGDDVITVNTGDSSDRARTALVFGGASDDMIEFHGRPAFALALGGSGHDSIISHDADPAAFWGGPGNDTLTGGEAADTLRGGPGDDRLIGREGNDRLVGGAGSNQLFPDEDGKPAIATTNDALGFSAVLLLT